VVRAFAHDATVVPGSDADDRAPGGAVTLALCGSWEHEPPCPLAPHHTATSRGPDGTLRLRILFAAAPADEAEVRRRIDDALTAGTVDGPDGVTTTWEFRGSAASDVATGEAAHAARLVASHGGSAPRS
jgi:hypothetical protein